MTESVVRHVRPAGGATGTRLEITPASVGWRYLSFRVVALEAGDTMDATLPGEELVVVPLAGSGRFRFDGGDHPVSRRDVFTAKPHVLYVPPGTACSIVADTTFELAIGSAPATGRYPARLYRPDELPSFVRGGANASRGVTATLDPGLETERLIAYEILTPSGNW